MPCDKRLGTVVASIWIGLPLAVGVIEHHSVVEVGRDVNVRLIGHFVTHLDSHHTGRRVDAVGHVAGIAPDVILGIGRKVVEVALKVVPRA